jgi:hypothetical protein
MKISEHKHRPVEPPVQKSEHTPETETVMPKERCLDGDQILEVEEDTSIANIPKETSLLHSLAHQDEHITATTSEMSGDAPEIQDKHLQPLPEPPIETAPETPVELASSPQVVDTSTPEGKLVASKLEMSTNLSSWKGSWNLQSGSSPCRYNKKRSSSYSLHSKVLNPISRSSSKASSSSLQTTHHNSSIKMLSDVYDHNNITPLSKCNGKIVQDMNSACSELPDYNSQQELHSMIPHDKLNRNLLYDVGNKQIQPCHNKIRHRSSLNSKQKLVKTDSQNLKDLVRSSSMITAKPNSDFVVVPPGKYKHGFEADACNHLHCETVMSSSELEKSRSNLMSEQIKCYSLIPQEHVIHNTNLSDIRSPSGKNSALKNVGNSPYNSPAVAKRKYDGCSAEGQLSPEKRVSLLVPPPPDFLITRGESSQSWNKFLQDLAGILENRAEFV